ncbi:hypothetical protein [Ancylobacter sp.]|uniref:hypothetical protein n=1 Tax=Ancylobacter sp. TaxID=1872567 RepID=UPI003D0A812B
MQKTIITLAAVIVSAAAIYFVVSDQLDRKARREAAAAARHAAMCNEALREAKAYTEGRSTAGMESLNVVQAKLRICSGT